MMTFIALLPLLSLFLFMVILEKPAYISAPISLSVTAAASLLYWRMEIDWFGASLIRGGFIALEIVIILIGVLLMVSVLKKANAFLIIDQFVSKLSKDARVQAIFLAWFLVAFMEGVAGFGTPAMVAAPLMVILGFSPLSAITMTLIADAVPVTFGAAGVPITIGIAEGVSVSQAAMLGPGFVMATAVSAALFHLIIGTFIPFIILCVLGLIQDKSLRKAFAAWKFALASGLAFTVPSALTAFLLGPEFPSIIGSLIGAAIMILLVRRGITVPKETWVLAKKSEDEYGQKVSYRRLMPAIAPYVFVVAMLFLTRLNIFGAGEFFRGVSFGMSNSMGTTVSYILYPLYSAGFFFFIAALVSFVWYRLSFHDALDVLKITGKKVGIAAVSLVAVLGIVQIMIFSDHNLMEYPSFTGHVLSKLTAAGALWPLAAPFVGLFGTFIAGSSTVSNLLFASVQVDTAVALGMAPVLGLVLQSIGSAAGNMIAVHNIIAVSTVVHVHHVEGKVFKYNILPALGYSLAAGVIGLLIMYVAL